MVSTTRTTLGRPARTKATFTLATDLLMAVKEAARGGQSKSAASFVTEALQEKLERIEADRRRTLLEEAAADPLFLADIASVQQDFAGSELPPRGRRRKRQS